MRALDGQLSVEPVDATASLRGLQPVIEPGKPGLELNRVKTAQRIEALLGIARRPQVVHPAARTVAPSVSTSDFGALVVIYRGSNELHLYKGDAALAHLPGRDRPVDLPDAGRRLARRRHAAQPVVAPAGLAPGRRA